MYSERAVNQPLQRTEDIIEPARLSFIYPCHITAEWLDKGDKNGQI
jgi:hypothetical protein